MLLTKMRSPHREQEAEPVYEFRRLTSRPSGRHAPPAVHDGQGKSRSVSRTEAQVGSAVSSVRANAASDHIHGFADERVHAKALELHEPGLVQQAPDLGI